MLSAIKSKTVQECTTIDAQFYTRLTQELLESAYQTHLNNIDFDRYGYPSPEPFLKRITDTLITKAIRLLAGKKRFIFLDENSYKDRTRIEGLREYLSGFSFLYDQLKDEASRNLLIKLIALRILGPSRVKLPQNTPEYWAKRKFVQSLIKGSDFIQTKVMNWKLFYFELEPIGYPIRMFFLRVGVLNKFILKHYEYGQSNPIIKANEGDIVIDGGGCWGDTALYFAHEVGSQGKVYSFEFVPANLEILEKNLNLNPLLKPRIEVIKNALLDKSEQSLYYFDNGPGSKVSPDKQSNEDFRVTTISIDDFVQQNNLKKVDFIKMDIEGAELNALNGAVDTLRKFRPKLAISLYHHLDDFTNIPQFIASLDLGYDFYLGHCTIHTEETVLFAINRSGMT